MDVMNFIQKAAVAVLLAVTVAASPAFANDAAEQFVQKVLDEAQPYLELEDEQAQLDGIATLVDKYVDMRHIGYFVLGKSARQITSEQKEEYFPLFEDYARSIYQEALTRYSGERLAVTGSVDRSEKNIFVQSKVANAKPGDEYADTLIEWWVHVNNDGEMRIVDAGADGIFLSIEQQETFTSIIADNGGPPAGIDALIENIREKVDD